MTHETQRLAAARAKLAAVETIIAAIEDTPCSLYDAELRVSIGGKEEAIGLYSDYSTGASVLAALYDLVDSVRAELRAVESELNTARVVPV